MNTEKHDKIIGYETKLEEQMQQTKVGAYQWPIENKEVAAFLAGLLFLIIQRALTAIGPQCLNSH